MSECKARNHLFHPCVFTEGHTGPHESRARVAWTNDADPEVPRIVLHPNGDIEVWNDGHSHMFTPTSRFKDVESELRSYQSEHRDCVARAGAKLLAAETERDVWRKKAEALHDVTLDWQRACEDRDAAHEALKRLASYRPCGNLDAGGCREELCDVCHARAVLEELDRGAKERDEVVCFGRRRVRRGTHHVGDERVADRRSETVNARRVSRAWLLQQGRST